MAMNVINNKPRVENGSVPALLCSEQKLRQCRRPERSTREFSASY